MLAEWDGHVRRAAMVSLSVLLMLVLFPADPARAQYPPPTPGPTSSPTAGAFLECTAEAGPDFLIVECTGGGFAAGSEVLVEIYVVFGSSAAPGINAAPLAGEELYDAFVVTTDSNGDFDVQRHVGVCDLQGMRVEATGQSESGNPVSDDDTIERGLLECAGGTLGSGGGGSLSTTGADWLRWLTLGLVLVTAGAWIANVRDEREATDHRLGVS